MNTPDAVAHRILQAYRLNSLISATPEEGPADLAMAYAAQETVWQTLSGNVRPTAWKVGTPTRTEIPLAAPVFPPRLAATPARFSGTLFTHLGIEAEIALCFGRDLPPRAVPYSRAEILAAIASVHVAMELVDTRLADPEAAGPLWRLADNLVNGALVLGEVIPHWRDLDWTRQSAQAWADGRALADGGKPPLDDLFHCLPWWLDHVGGARAGDIVTTGAWHGMHPVGQARELVVTFTGLGTAVAWIDREHAA